MKKIAVYPGTFNPVTLGHLDMIEVGSAIFDKLIVGILINSQKKNLMFSEQDRLKMIEVAIKETGLDNVSVKIFNGWTVDFARQEKAIAIIRGLRMTTEYEAELNMAFNNKVLAKDIHTILIPPLKEHIHISSTIVRDLVKDNRAGLHGYLPKSVIKYIFANLK